jgi:hypothetical protein
MADKKISQLTAATTPLAGTEVVPIVQSSSTVKVPVDDLTVRNLRAAATTGIMRVSGPAAGTTRTMTVPNANFTAARTDAAQSFTGIQTMTNGLLTGSKFGITASIDFSNVASFSFDLSTFQTVTNKALSIFIQTAYEVSAAGASSSLIHGNRKPNGTWAFSTISNLGDHTATGSGSGDTATVTFSAGNQYGNAVIYLVVGA